VRTADDQYILCQRCHEGEVAEWNANKLSGGAHSVYQQSEEYGVDGCFCHQINKDQLADHWGLAGVEDYDFEHWNGSGEVTEGNWSFRTNETPHAALSVLCTDCHMNASTQLNQSNSAHQEFYVKTIDKPEGSSNTACMACHTMIGLNITMERIASGIELVADHTNYTAGWNVTVAVNNTERTTNATYWAPGEIPNSSS